MLSLRPVGLKGSGLVAKLLGNGSSGKGSASQSTTIIGPVPSGVIRRPSGDVWQDIDVSNDKKGMYLINESQKMVIV